MKKDKDRVPYFLAVVSAILAAIPFAFPSTSIVLTILCLIPLMVGLCQCRTSRAGWKLGYVYGLITIAFQVFFFDSLTSRWTQSAILGLVPWVIGSALGACYFGLFGWLSVRMVNRRWFAAIPFIWTAVEIIRSYIPLLAFPWGLVATPLAHYPRLIQFAHQITIYGGSFWIASFGAIAALFYAVTDAKERRTQARILACFLLIPLVFDLAPIHPKTTPLKVLVCQPGVNTGFLNPITAKAMLETAATKTMQTAKSLHPGLTIFPEGFTRIANPTFISPPFAVSAKLPVIFGAQRGNGPVYQSAFSYDGQWHWADKTRLVIFGEYVPYRHEIPFLSSFNLPTEDLTPGLEPTILPVNNFKVGPLICFEELFPDISYRLTKKHAQLLSVISDDAWFVGSYAPIQLNEACVWRAIESGLPVARSGMTGYSDLITLHGRIIKRLPFGPYGTIAGTVQVPTDPTFPVWLPIFPAIALVLGVYLPIFCNKKTINL